MPREPKRSVESGSWLIQGKLIQVIDTLLTRPHLLVLQARQRIRDLQDPPSTIKVEGDR